MVTYGNFPSVNAWATVEVLDPTSRRLRHDRELSGVENITDVTDSDHVLSGVE